jgi:hypothetical protein
LDDNVAQRTAIRYAYFIRQIVLSYSPRRYHIMTELEHINSNAYIMSVLATLNYTTPEFISESYTNPLCYNLIEEATADCLSGTCDHSCGEPTQFDLERLEQRGLTDIVDAYENNLQHA